MKKLWVPLSSNQWNQNLLIKEENNSNRRRRLQQTKKKGQSMGYGTHYATIFTAFLCKGCEGCGEEHHTDRYFDPEASTTFIALTCDQCHAAQCEVDRCVFSQTYTEGSSWHAYESIPYRGWEGARGSLVVC